MAQIFKTWKGNTYFEGTFKLRDKSRNWASPIDFPTVFVAYGAAIKSGNWRRCTGINTPSYVIDNYFDTIGHEKHHALYQMWEYCKQLEDKTWAHVEADEAAVLELIALANNELGKLVALS